MTDHACWSQSRESLFNLLAEFLPTGIVDVGRKSYSLVLHEESQVMGLTLAIELIY